MRTLNFGPVLSGRKLDIYHTHGVALVRTQNAGLKCAARGSLEMKDPKNRQKVAIWAPSHNFVGLYIGWQWRNFFISAVFRHFVGQALCVPNLKKRLQQIQWNFIANFHRSILVSQVMWFKSDETELFSVSFHKSSVWAVWENKRILLQVYIMAYWITALLSLVDKA